MLKKTVLLLALLPALSLHSMDLEILEAKPINLLTTRADLYRNTHYLSQNEVLLELAYHGKLFQPDAELIDVSDKYFLKQLLEQSILGAIDFENEQKGHHINNIGWIIKTFFKSGFEIQTLQDCMSLVAKSNHPRLQLFFKDLLNTLQTNNKSVPLNNSPKSSPQKKTVVVSQGKLAFDKRSDAQKIQETEYILTYHQNSGRKANLRTRIARISNSIELPNRSTTLFAFFALALFAAYYLDERLFQFLLLLGIGNSPLILAFQNHGQNQELQLPIGLPFNGIQNSVNLENINLVPEILELENDHNNELRINPLNFVNNVVQEVAPLENEAAQRAILYVDPNFLDIRAPQEEVNHEHAAQRLEAPQNEVFPRDYIQVVQHVVRDDFQEVPVVIQEIHINAPEVVIHVEKSHENEKDHNIASIQEEIISTPESYFTRNTLLGGLLTATVTVLALKKYQEWSLKQKNQESLHEDSQKVDFEKAVPSA